MADEKEMISSSKDYGQYRGVMVWIAMSSMGILHVERIKGKLDAARYADLVCGDAMADIHALHGCDFVFQQDNASPHRADLTKNTFREREIACLHWPSLSPDLNPVENLWAEIVRKVYCDGKYYNSDEELWKGILSAVQTIPPSTCAGLISSMKGRLIKVLDYQGGYVQEKK
jgi:hypothetical protein